MSALQRLAEKIEACRIEFKDLKKENIQLKDELNKASNVTVQLEEMRNENIHLKEQLDNASNTKSEIETLKQEIQAKDAEIEKIIAQVETLLS